MAPEDARHEGRRNRRAMKPVYLIGEQAFLGSRLFKRKRHGRQNFLHDFRRYAERG